MKQSRSSVRAHARLASSASRLLACAAGTVLFAAQPVAGAAARTLPSAITFKGYCDGITNIRFHPGHTGTGTVVMTGTWDFSACGLANEPTSGITGNDLREAVTGTFDTKSRGDTAIVVRIFNDSERDWFSIDELGRVINNGKWVPGAPGDGVRGLPMSSLPRSALRSGPVADATPNGLPDAIHFDDRCDGIVDIEKRRVRLQSIVTGIRDLSKCGFSNTNFTAMGNGDHDGGRDTVGTFDVATQGEGWNVQTVEIFRDRTWIIYDLEGHAVDRGTWSPGPPLENDGPPAGHP